MAWWLALLAVGVAAQTKADPGRVEVPGNTSVSAEDSPVKGNGSQPTMTGKVLGMNSSSKMGQSFNCHPGYLYWPLCNLCCRNDGWVCNPQRKTCVKISVVGSRRRAPLRRREPLRRRARRRR
ncbi:unnamed protein product [Symbiodinium natans]|uniref:Uncharacterized protein n=1 Tax=Symbiodinium natans TaxID=878477 RepID=A0A812M834_9DINO|nr:unnamed protein product [Symbiodinium natans]